MWCLSRALGSSLSFIFSSTLTGTKSYTICSSYFSSSFSATTGRGSDFGYSGYNASTIVAVNAVSANVYATIGIILYARDYYYYRGSSIKF